MHSLAVVSPKTGSSGPAAAAAAPAAALTAVTLSRGRSAPEICDKPGELTLLLQLGHGRAPTIGALDRAVFDEGARYRLIGDFENGRAGANNRHRSIKLIEKIKNIFSRSKDKTIES